MRNVQGCHLAGACPFEVLDISPWAEAAFQHFLRNPIGQRLPRKFKINFSGCATDCGQAMFNDVGVIATARTRDDGTVEAGFRDLHRRRPRREPASRPWRSRTSRPREDLLPTIEAILRVFEQTGNRKNKLRARMKWLVDTLGFEELQERIFAIRKFLLASSTWPGGIPAEVEKHGDAPAGVAVGVVPTAIGQGTPVAIRGTRPYERWEQANVVRGVAKGTVSANVYSHLGDVTSEQFRALATIQRDLGLEVRITNRQNFVLPRPHREPAARRCTRASSRSAWPSPAPSCPATSSPAPAPTPATWPSRSPAAWPTPSAAALEAEGLAEVGGVRINISGCTNSCGQHHASDIGFFGAERRAHGQAAPGYQMLLGGYVGDEQIHFGEKALRLPAKNAPTGRGAGRRPVRRRARGRRDLPHAGSTAPVGAKAVAAELKDLDQLPRRPTRARSSTSTYGETGPYVAEIGESECAT